MIQVKSCCIALFQCWLRCQYSYFDDGDGDVNDYGNVNNDGNGDEHDYGQSELLLIYARLNHYHCTSPERRQNSSPSRRTMRSLQFRTKPPR